MSDYAPMDLDEEKTLVDWVESNYDSEVDSYDLRVDYSSEDELYEDNTRAREAHALRQAELHATFAKCKFDPKQRQSVLDRFNKKCTEGEPEGVVEGKCMLWNEDKGRDYYQIGVGPHGMIMAHRASYMIFWDVHLPPEIQARHMCNVPNCVNPAHLMIGDAQDNADDKVRSGRSLAGTRNPASNLTEEAVMDIFENEMTPKQCKAKYGVSRDTVREIRLGISYSSVTGAKPNKKRKRTEPEDLNPCDEEIAKKYVASRVKKEGEHWIWTKKFRDKGGYGLARFKGKGYLAHNFSCRVFSNGCKRIPEKMQVLHGCTRKDCVNPDHLSIGSPAQNAADRQRDGTAVIGTKHPNAKLENADILVIRRRAAAGETHAEIKKDYPVKLTAIGDIVARRTWAHIPEEVKPQ